jgi:hypothetical protein
VPAAGVAPVSLVPPVGAVVSAPPPPAPALVPCCVVAVFVATAPALAVLLCEITSSPGLLILMMITMF